MTFMPCKYIYNISCIRALSVLVLSPSSLSADSRSWDEYNVPKITDVAGLARQIVLRGNSRDQAQKYNYTKNIAGRKLINYATTCTHDNVLSCILSFNYNRDVISYYYTRWSVYFPWVSEFNASFRSYSRKFRAKVKL